MLLDQTTAKWQDKDMPCKKNALNAAALTEAHLGVIDKLLEAVHKVGAVEGVSANAHNCRLAQPCLRRLVDSLQNETGK